MRETWINRKRWTRHSTSKSFCNFLFGTLLNKQQTPKKKQVMCLGGPYDRQRIYITAKSDGKTAVFNIGPYRGRYIPAPGNAFCVVWETM